MLTFVAACFCSAFVVSWAVTRIMRKFARRWGLVDQPADRKVHKRSTPLGGGVAIVLGVVIPLGMIQIIAWFLGSTGSYPEWIPSFVLDHLEGVRERSGSMWIILAGGATLAILGLLDDKYNLPWKPRLAIQFLIAIAMTLSGVKGSFFIMLPWIASAITVFWILGLINSFNFLDNMNGLSAGIAFIASVLFAIIMLTSLSEPRWLVGGVMLVLAGSLGGFLYHNWRGKIFMGDSGSYFIGLMMACMTVLGTFYDSSNSSKHVILAPLCILAVPLYDTCSVILIRLMQGRSPFQPDKSHFSHRLVDLGMSQKNAVLTVYLTTLTTGIGALLLYHVDNWQGAWLVLALVCCVLAVIAILETAGRNSS
ncbi:Undecaprenyl-phosphate alpha-N-acetylglucosaminyl 1-phosphate transferase [hydrothermal vent metagenome]|uniref:Undecaprenyl-phosphate alpha-N-acetylglucosaminyl 1-phosphate transferase n=1 Tax=hydrothermal vent metagenome TaxID=652676 RepID=A0A3B1E0H1_9ZZZZ